MARRQQASIAAANEAARKALATAASTPGANPDHLGDLAWWDPRPGWKGDVAEVRAVFQRHGFEPDHILPASPDWPVAFGRAVTHVKSSLAKSDTQLVEAKPGPNGERRWNVLRLTRGEEVTTKDVGTVACPKDGAAPYVERADPGGVASSVVESAKTYFGRYISDDIRNAVVETFERWAAMPCRSRIPYIVYWVPPAGGSILRSLSDACEEAGWGRIEIFAGHATDERSRRACVNAVNDGLESRLTAFAAEVKEYADANPERTRAVTIEKKLSEASRLRDQGKLYREILGVAVSSIDERIAEIETSLRSTLGLVEAAHAAE